jgi:hypothetical protein
VVEIRPAVCITGTGTFKEQEGLGMLGSNIWHVLSGIVAGTAVAVTQCQ